MNILNTGILFTATRKENYQEERLTWLHVDIHNFFFLFSVNFNDNFILMQKIRNCECLHVTRLNVLHDNFPFLSLSYLFL